tara:strand:+ start:799 stop:1623 length:825 start_codon:yes stop_codon:yes gene_type:complete
LININFHNKETDFWKCKRISDDLKFDHNIALQQAFDQNVLLEQNKNLLLKFIYFLKDKKNINSQLYQDIFAEFIVNNSYEKSFLEFGATDGKHLSNSFTLEENFGWKGVLAEPDPQWHNNLKLNRPNSKIIYECIWKKSDEKMNFFSSEIGAFSTLDDFRYSDKDTLPGNTSARNKKGKNFEVKTISINKVIEDEFKGVSPSYISVDTEGSEFEILNSFDFSKYRPIVFTVEHNFTKLQSKIDQLMIKNKYVRVFEKLTAFDAWYISAEIQDIF